jgi:rhodanese-related sulfurtransferase
LGGKMMPSIQISELLTYNNPIIVDIRNKQNYNNNHIDGAINIPYQELIMNPSKYLEKNKKYFIYCQKGITSTKICNILYNQGYRVVNIIGGYEEWIMKK